MSDSLQQRLEVFKKENGVSNQGPLCVALVVTHHAKKRGLPLNPDSLVTKGGGQVIGLGKSSVQAILKHHGIKRVLASEGGRTSRGSLGLMRIYVRFLNDLHNKKEVDLEKIELFWVEAVKTFFASKPFKIKADPSKSLRTVIRGVFDQTKKRQKSHSGMHYSGAVLQHLVGAKLDCALGKGHFKHHGFSTADSPRSRAADFVLEDVAIHVTMSPNEAVILKCLENLDEGFRPILVTSDDGVGVAAGLANNIQIEDRLDIFEIEQFIALNLYELGKFSPKGRRTTLAELIDRYNEIIDQVETNPSLKISLGR